MRTICFLEGDMSRGGGTERMTALIANELAIRKRYKILIVSIYNQNSSSYYRLENSIKHISLNSRGNSKKNKLINTILHLKKILKEQEVDYLVNVDIMLVLYSIPASIFSKIKMISWEHFNYLDDIGSKYTFYIRKLALIYSDYYVVLTRKDKEKFMKHKHKQLVQIYNTYSMDNKYECYDENSKIIMSAGNMYEVKGFDRVIEIGKLVFDKYSDWKWYIYGDGIELENIKRKILINNLQDNIFIKPRTKEIERAYRESAMFVLTSKLESFGLVLLEAQVNNLPVLSFDIPSGPSEIIENNINGFLVEENNIEEMAEKICLLIENNKLRKKFSLNSKKKIDNFDINKIISKWERIFDSL